MEMNGKQKLHILPVVILALSLILLFAAPRLLEPYIAVVSPPEDASHYLQGARVFGPAGDKTLDDAVKAGWVKVDIGVPDEYTARFENKTDRSIDLWLSGGEHLTVYPLETRFINTIPNAANPLSLESFKAIMPIMISIVLLFGSLFIILAKRYAAADRHWAYATVGTIVGYWLKG